MAPVLAVRLPIGDQVYVSAPVTVSVVELPLQIVAGMLVVRVGSGLTVTVIVGLLAQKKLCGMLPVMV